MTTAIVNNKAVYIGYGRGSFFIAPIDFAILAPANGKYEPYFWDGWVE